jgi:hypothetical protein
MKARRVGTALAELGDGQARRDPFPVLFHQKGTDPLVAGSGIGGGENRDAVCDPGVGDPVLGAVQDVIVAVFFRPAADAGYVGARQGLGGGKGDEPEFGCDPGKDPLLEGLVGAKDKRIGSQGVVEDGRGEPRAGGGDLLADQAHFQGAETPSAVFGGDIGVHQAGLEGLTEDEKRDFVIFIVMPGNGEHLLEGELPGLEPKLFLLGGEGEIQHSRLLSPKIPGL